ncbi:MAG: hypothetical protein ACOY33_01255 [Pseudomonadota bacterium]
MIYFMLSLIALFGAYSAICVDVLGSWNSTTTFGSAFLSLLAFVLVHVVGTYHPSITGWPRTVARLVLAPLAAIAVSVTLFRLEVAQGSIGLVSGLLLIGALYLASDPWGLMSKAVREAVERRPKDQFISALVVENSAANYLLLVAAICGLFVVFAAIKLQQRSVLPHNNSLKADVPVGPRP